VRYCLDALWRLVRTLARWVSAAVTLMLITCVRGYQVAIAPLLIGSCKFAPTCSEYFLEAVKVYGPVRGTLMGLWRICRCNPFGKGGIDPVRPPRESKPS
jgi:uncharacterized protein